MERLNDQETQAHKLKIAKDLELDVKNINFFSGHDGMQGINADIYHKGKKFATGYDDARGGGMDVRPSSYDVPVMAVFHEIETKLKTLPEYTHVHTVDRNDKKLGGKPFEYNSRVGLDDIVDAIAEAKERLKKDKKGIVYKEGDEQYVSHWNMSLPAMLKKFPKNALPTIQKKYESLVAEKYTILNKSYLSEIGVRV